MKELLIRLLSKNRSVKKISKCLWDFFRMHIFEIVHLHTYDQNLHLKRIYVFGKVINCPKVANRNVSNVFYFKINRENDYSLMSIQHWINSLNQLDEEYVFYFVCDNRALERKIVRFICFENNNIYFMPSMYKKLKDIAENLYTGYWRNATYAHLTPFYHAKDQGYKHYWAIDGDDTMFCTDPSNVAKILKKAEHIANKQNITVFSLDMWRSRTHGKHWSLGVVYFNDNNDICHFFDENKDKQWITPYREWDVAFNVDWFFNYLKDYKKVKIETFYVPNCYFIHWGDFFRNIIGSSICYWTKKHIIFPILKDVLDNEKLGKLSISSDAIKINVNLILSDGIDFLENEVSLVRTYPPELRKLNFLNNFGNKTKYYY